MHAYKWNAFGNLDETVGRSVDEKHIVSKQQVTSNNLYKRTFKKIGLNELFYDK